MSIGGDPSGVEAAAAALRTAGSGFTDVADDIASHARGLRAEWIGEASDAAHDALIGLSTRTRVGHDVAVGAAAVLEQYARSLRSAQSAYAAASDAQASAAADQQSAGAALSAAQGASGQVAAGTTTATSVGAEAPAVATASAAVAAADRAATAAAVGASDAVSAAAAADQLAAAAIDALVEQLPAMRGTSAGAPDRRGQSQGSHASSDHDGSWWGGAWSWTTEHASDISSVAGTAAAVTAFIPGVDVIGTPLLMGVAVASGALATEQDVAHGENGQAVVDGGFTILNAVPGAGALRVAGGVDRAGRIFSYADELTEKTAALDRGRQLLGGKSPLNVRYAGRSFPLPEALSVKYPEGVKFTAEGFPDFSPYAVKTVTIHPLGPTREADFARANLEAGLPKTPRGYVWHHVEDGSMQLIPRDIHAEVRHTGGIAVGRLNGFYK